MFRIQIKNVYILIFLPDIYLMFNTLSIAFNFHLKEWQTNFGNVYFYRE